MKVLYFAWIRERVGLTEENVFPPADVVTIETLMHWLAARSDGHAAAFADPAAVRAAVNHEHAVPEATVRADDEVAFFPPVTGG